MAINIPQDLNIESIYTTTPTFNWFLEDGAGNECFHIEMAPVSGAVSGSTYVSGLTSYETTVSGFSGLSGLYYSHETITPLYDGVDYYWRVSVCNADFSDIDKFTLDAIPNFPDLVIDTALEFKDLPLDKQNQFPPVKGAELRLLMPSQILIGGPKNTSHTLIINGGTDNLFYPNGENGDRWTYLFDWENVPSVVISREDDQGNKSSAASVRNLYRLHSNSQTVLRLTIDGLSELLILPPYQSFIITDYQYNKSQQLIDLVNADVLRILNIPEPVPGRVV